ncbi:hypothetical protein ABIF68_002500 [Bradyrhizobium japonicum]
MRLVRQDVRPHQSGPKAALSRIGRVSLPHGRASYILAAVSRPRACIRLSTRPAPQSLRDLTVPPGRTFDRFSFCLRVAFSRSIVASGFFSLAIARRLDRGPSHAFRRASAAYAQDRGAARRETRPHQHYKRSGLEETAVLSTRHSTWCSWSPCLAKCQIEQPPSRESLASCARGVFRNGSGRTA